MRRALSGELRLLPSGERQGTAPAARDAFYYLQNFEAVLCSVGERYADLLHPAEHEFLDRFQALPRVCRALLVRMVMRKGVLFRESRLAYAEIGDPQRALAPLLRLGWVEADPSLRVDELSRLLRKAELLSCFASERLAARLPKSACVAQLRAVHPALKPFSDWWADAPDRLYRLTAARFCERFRLMFFGNFRQDWSEFVLADLGIFAYETAPLLKSRAFTERAELDAFEQLYYCRQALHEGAEPGVVCAQLPAPIDGSAWLEERRQKLLFQIAAAWQRAGDADRALTLYARCTHRGARMRSIRLLIRRAEWTAALELCLAVRDRPLHDAEREQAVRLLPRIQRRLGIVADHPRTQASLRRFELILDGPGPSGRVEYAVRDRLQAAASGSNVYYVENALINSLFGLLCWDAIFAPIAGAFLHDFQHGPADLGSEEFCARRAAPFRACLESLSSGAYQATIRRQHAAKRGLQSPFVAWGLMDESLLELALRCFPAADLRLWFDWILRDLRENRSGFPDLVQFWPGERRYRLVEVKGPGDRVQDNQARLLRHCAARGIPVEVCHVRWTAASTAPPAD
jgi:hypothetical protein